jgi:hypothetical protein
MKKFTVFAFTILLSGLVLAQAPDLFNYQGVARDNGGNPLSNQPIGLQLSILEGSSSGAPVYAETWSLVTNDLGLFSVRIGEGTVVSGSIYGIEWGAAKHYLKVEMDESGGTAYQHIGTSQLVSVPYALYAEETFCNVSAILFNCPGNNTTVFNNIFAKAFDLGTFNKEKDNTLVELLFQSRLLVQNFSGGSTGAVFELRVNDQPTATGRARFNYLVDEAGLPGLPATFGGVFDNLPAGNHTVSIWVMTLYGSCESVYADPGCWDVGQVLVKEY